MRGLLLVLIAVGLAVGAWLFLNPADEGGYDTGGPDDPTELAVEPEEDVQLVGRALDEPVEMAVAERPRGIYVIRGAVIDAAGKPAAGVRIQAVFRSPGWSDHSPEAVAWRAHDRVVARAARMLREGPDGERNVLAEAVSDAKGAFELDVGRTGSYFVHARPDAPLVGNRAWATVSKAAPTPEVTLRVEAGHALAGRVETQTGAPVEAVLTVALATRAPGASSVIDQWTSEPFRSDADGRFALPAAPLGKLLFDVVVPGRVSAKGMTAQHEPGVPITLVIPSGTASIGGTVVDGDEKAIVDADVIVTLSPWARGTGREIDVAARSAGDGTWSIDALPPGEVKKIRAVAPGYVALMQTAPQARWSPLELTAEKPHTMTLRLLRGGTVRGRVTVADVDAPLEGVKVRLAMWTSAMGHDHQPLREAVTDAEGGYAIAGVPAGRYVLFASHETHYLPAFVAPAKPLETDGAAPPTPFLDAPELTVVMPNEGGDQVRHFEMRPGVRVRGIVEDPQGAPVAGANVSVLAGLRQVRVPGQNVTAVVPTTTDDTGRFEIANLPAGKGFTFVAKKTGFAAERGDPIDLLGEGDGPELVLKLVAGAVLRGVVVDQDGDPVPGAQVSLWGGTANYSGTQPSARADADGAFEIRGLSSGDYQHWAWAPGGVNGQGQGPKGLETGEVREDFRITVRGTVQADSNPAKVRVVDDKGRPVATKMIQMRAASMHHMMQTDADGEAVVPQQAQAEPVTLTMFGAGGRNEIAKDVTFRPGEVREFVYTPPERKRIVGYVYDPQGVRVPLFRYGLKGGGSSRGMPMEYAAMEGAVMPASMPAMRGGGEAVNGEFVLDVTGDGPWTILISNARDRRGESVGLAKLEHEVKELPSGPIDIRLNVGETVRGRVVDTHGKPVVGVRITCSESKDTSDERGEFALAGMSGETTLYAQPPGGQGWVRPKPLKVKVGDAVEFVLEEGQSITGLVVNEAGEPVENLYVNASWPSGEGFTNGNVNSQAGKDGTFELKGIPGRAKVSLNVHAWGGAQTYAPWNQKDVVPGTRDMRIVMTVGAAISGVVKDAEGKPLTTGYVQAQPVDKDKGLSWGWGQISSDGAFEIKNTKPGTYRLMVQIPGTRGRVDLGEATAPSTGLDLQLPVRATIAGRIDSEAKGFRVTAFRPKGQSVEQHSGTVKGDGSFTIDVPEGGAAWTIYAYSESAGQHGFARNVAPGAENAQVRTEQGRTISGRVEDGDGKGVPGARVTAQTPTKDPVYGTARADKDGRFEIKGLPDGTYNLSAWGMGGSKTKKNVEAGAVDVVLK